ncbi:MAG: 2-amino-4-hydroxy-6-hydroxymethyldihydropteridine diphosphokinase [Bacteroidaceae bacterium]|nr:2-amino-4-hydroxy-6-hydroxymethyldihydropteridine diphosphokinase [Bacteroidaceae bacterium]
MPALYLSLGTNLGDRQKNLDCALTLIAERVGTVVCASDRIETQPWGFVSDNSFLNMAVKVETGLSPIEALHTTQAIERELGRSEKTVDGQYQDRLIDIDLLMYITADAIPVRLDTPELTLPHPLMRQREFVMKPLGQIAPELVNM